MSKRWWTVALVLAAIVPAIAGFGAVYVIARGADNDAVDERTLIAQATPPASASAANPLSQGDMTKFVFKREPEAVGDIAFVDGTGAADRKSVV